MRVRPAGIRSFRVCGRHVWLVELGDGAVAGDPGSTAANTALAFTHKHQRDRSLGAPARPQRSHDANVLARKPLLRAETIGHPRSGGHVEATSIVGAGPASVCTRDSRGAGGTTLFVPSGDLGGRPTPVSRLPSCRYGLRPDRRCRESPASLNRSIAARAVVVHGGERLEQMALDESVEPDDVVVVQPPSCVHVLWLHPCSQRACGSRRSGATLPLGDLTGMLAKVREFCETFGEDLPLGGGTRAGLLFSIGLLLIVATLINPRVGVFRAAICANDLRARRRRRLPAAVSNRSPVVDQGVRAIGIPPPSGGGFEADLAATSGCARCPRRKWQSRGKRGGLRGSVR